jgi:Domain of unknown function (DUF1854).
LAQITKDNTLKNIIAVKYITKDNAAFARVNDFITLSVTFPVDEVKTDSDGAEVKTEGTETKDYDRIFLHRAFPYDYPWSFISVLDSDSKEIGIIRDLTDLTEETAELVKYEIERKYFAPKVTKISSVKERYGFSYWKVTTDAGEMEFTLQDTYRSLLKVSSTRLFIVDIDSNRYEIPDIEQLDRKSVKKIEVYL